MALVMTPIYTQTVGAGGVSNVTFNNIPQYFTDLLVLYSQRNNSSNINESLAIGINNDTNQLYSNTVVFGDGSAAQSTRASGNAYISYTAITVNGNTSTANTFSNTSVYIPNYTQSNFKQMLIESVAENNASAANLGMGAGLYRSTNPITSLKFIPYTGSLIMQHSTFSLYGIIRSGA